MAPPAVASSRTGLRSVLLISILLQLAAWVCAEDPVRIFLILKDKRHLLQQYGNIPAFTDLINTAVQGIYDGQEVKFDQNKHNEVTKSGRKILYVSAEIKEDETQAAITWGDGRNAEELAEIVSGIFEEGKDIFVTVVFPEFVTETVWGYNFMEAFERKTKEKHMSIGIGSTRVKLHLGFKDDKKKFDSKVNEIKQTDKKDFLNILKRTVLVVHDDAEDRMFSFVKDKWVSTQESEFPGKIREADQVTIAIESDCSVDQSKLRVDRHDEDGLAKILTDLLGKKEHPQQRVKVVLECEHEKKMQNNEKKLFVHNEKKLFVNTVVSKMKSIDKELDVYGKLPCVILHIDIDPNEESGIHSFLNIKLAQAWKGSCLQFAVRKFGNSWKSVVYKGKNDLEEKDIDNNLIEMISQAEELSIQLNTDGRFGHEQSTGLLFLENPSGLANKLTDLFMKLKITPSKRIELIVYACNAGGHKGRKYLDTFLKNINVPEKRIDEVIAFNGWVYGGEASQNHIYVPNQLKHSAYEILSAEEGTNLSTIRLYLENDKYVVERFMWLLGNAQFTPEKYKYGRITIRIKWDATAKKAIIFPVVPASEYDYALWNLKQEGER